MFVCYLEMGSRAGDFRWYLIGRTREFMFYAWTRKILLLLFLCNDFEAESGSGVYRLIYGRLRSKIKNVFIYRRRVGNSGIIASVTGTCGSFLYYLKNPQLYEPVVGNGRVSINGRREKVVRNALHRGNWIMEGYRTLCTRSTPIIFKMFLLYGFCFACALVISAQKCLWRISVNFVVLFFLFGRFSSVVE